MNPFALWTDILLKSGKAVLESMQEAAARAERPRVAVVPTADAPPPTRPRAKPKRKARAKPKTKAKRRAKRARRAQSR